MKSKHFILFSLLVFSGLSAQEKKWPKLMQWFEGRIVEVRYDNTRGFWYLDWNGNLIPEMSMNYNDKTALFLYVDSTGQAISQARYEDANAFNGGLALISSPRRYVYDIPRKYGVINEQSELLSPLSLEKKYIIGQGLYVIDRDSVQEVFDRNSKKITACRGCAFETNLQMKHLIRSPRSQTNDKAEIQIMDLQGRVLLNRPGLRISQISNDISTRLGTYSTLQSSYQLYFDAGSNLSALVSSEGKVIMDSVNFSFFSRGKSCILKNKVACVIDTNFKILMPYSYAYHFYRPMEGHPQGAYCARKNGTYRVISPDNKQLVPMQMSYTEIWYKPESQLYEGRTEEGNFWYMSLKGDTIGSPLKFSEVSSMYPLMPGFIVKSRAEGRMGYLSEKGELLVPCIYDYLAYGGKDLFLYFRQNEGGYMDHSGNIKIRLEKPLTLSAFVNGYALCGLKVNDPSKLSPSAQSVYGGEESYQVQNQLIDSTGKFVSGESFDWLYVLKNGYACVIKNNDMYMVDKNLKKVIVNGNCQLMSYSYKGTALAYDPRKNTWGLVNDKLEILVPVIYDAIDTFEEEGAWYAYSLSSARGYESNGGFKNNCANIVNGKLKVTLKNQEQSITLPQ